ncbi:cytochrome C [Bdellovibrio sp.]|uniref:cytochrome C n=1 Tax=Bdellovibrio sp. TaxID=28201 RepID=UPI0039E581BC
MTLNKMILLGCLIATPTWAQNRNKALAPSIEQGRYLARVIGCNDCHTPMYGLKNGEVPEKDWLIGSPIGWMGPWGTTYATNLRSRVAGMSEDEWVHHLKTLRSRPPMPFFAVNALRENDSRSLYRFIKSLGDNQQVIPDALPPGEKPQTPYVHFDVLMPKPGK